MPRFTLSSSLDDTSEIAPFSQAVPDQVQYHETPTFAFWGPPWWTELLPVVGPLHGSPTAATSIRIFQIKKLKKDF